MPLVAEILCASVHFLCYGIVYSFTKEWAPSIFRTAHRTFNAHIFFETAYLFSGMCSLAAPFFVTLYRPSPRKLRKAFVQMALMVMVPLHLTPWSIGTSWECFAPLGLGPLPIAFRRSGPVALRSMVLCTIALLMSKKLMGILNRWSPVTS